MARVLNISTRTLRRAFPEETALIIERHHEYVLSARFVRTDETKKALEEIADRLRCDGRPLTVRNIWLEGAILVTPNSRFMLAFQQMLEADGTDAMY